MKKWKCQVCGYIHSGAQPPAKCPVCGSDQSRILSLDDDSVAAPPKAKPEPESPASPADGQEPLRKWRCSVCGYVHTGPRPPVKCPVCGADQSVFVDIGPAAKIPPPDAIRPNSTSAGIEAENGRQAAAPAPARVGPYGMLTAAMARLHAHPISVHIPNGVLPVAALFAFLALLGDHTGLSRAAVYNLTIVAVSMPFVLFAGFNDWKLRYGGHMTPVFLTKIICGTVVAVLSLVLVVWGWMDPEVLSSGSPTRGRYLILCLLALGAAGLAGYMGGKLVIFPSGDSEE